MSQKIFILLRACLINGLPLIQGGTKIWTIENGCKEQAL